MLVIIVPICGALSDRIGRRRIFPIVGAIGMIVLFYPLLLLLNQPGIVVYAIVSASGWVVLGIWQSVYPTIQAELFPASVRVSGIVVALCLVVYTTLPETGSRANVPPWLRLTPRYWRVSTWSPGLCLPRARRSVASRSTPGAVSAASWVT